MCVCEREKTLQCLTLTCLSCLSGSTPSRTAGFLGTSSPGPMADLYAAANQDSGVSSYISAASPAPSTGFSHGIGVGHRLPSSPTNSLRLTCMHECTRVLTKLLEVYSSLPLCVCMCVSSGSSDCYCLH